MRIAELSRPVSRATRFMPLFLPCIGVLSAAPLFAQNREPSEFVLGHDAYSIRRWTTDNGLPSNGVLDLAQTPDGYLWIATSAGLMRFDGKRLVQIDLTTDGEREDTYAWHIEVDTAGTLWAVMTTFASGGELARRVGGAWERVLRFEGTGATPTAAAAAPDGAIWLAFGNEPDGGVVRWREGKITRYDVADLSFGALAAARSGAVWVGTNSSAVVRIEGDQMTRFALGGDARSVLTVHEDDHGRIWLGTNTGLYGWDGDSFEPYPTSGEGGIWQIGGNGTGHLWLNWFDNSVERVAIPQARAETASAATTVAPYVLGTAVSSLEDAEGNHWFGFTQAGLVQFRRHMLPAPSADPEEPMNPNLVYSIAPRTAESMWIAEDCRARVARPDGTRYTLSEGFPEVELFPPAYASQRTRLHPFHPDCLRGLAVGRTGALWFVHGQNGVTRVKDGVATAFWYPKLQPDYELGTLPFPKGVPSHLIADAAGDLWYVRQAEGIVSLSSTGEQIVYPFPNDSTAPEVKVLRPGRAGEVWFGTATGFGRVSLAEGDRWNADEWVSSARVTDFYVDSDGLVWVSSLGGGLLAIDGNSVTPITRADGLHDDHIFRVLETDDGNLWLPSRRGVMVVARADLRDYLDGGLNRLDVGLLRHNDGAPEFRQSRAAAEKGPDGRMWLFGGRGTVVADPAEMRWNDTPPTVVVEEISADGEMLAGTETFVVGAGTRSIDIRYTAATFDAPDRVRFRYRLDGQDEAWVEAGDRRLTSYSNLWPGEYTFRVIARKNFGPWTEEPATVQIRVLPLWWQTGWFMVAAVLGILALGAGLQTLRTRSVRLRNITLEREITAREAAEVELKVLGQRMITAQEEDRARIARDLHDDISQRLHAAAIGVDPALRAMATDQDDATERLQAIQEQLDGVAEDARKISHELHPATLEILGLASAIEGLGEDFEAISGITTRVEAPESVQELASTQVSLCLYRITQEALRNIAKHANAKNVDVELWAGADTIRLRIHDDGVGFDQKGVPAGLGLASMRERARLLGGKLTVDSEPGAGTELTVELPVQGEDR